MQNILSDAELLARLVSFDTTSRNSNLPLAEFISDYLDRPGVRIERNPSADGDKTNLIISVGPETDPERRDGLVLSGHMDVVPADEPEWQSDPFELTETDDSYVGRGACDMKGFVALAVNQVARIDPARLRQPLVLVLTYDEEIGTFGAERFVETWPRDRPLPRRTIVGEPSSLQVVRMHKGHATLNLVFTGRSAHSGYPHLGHNAIETAGRAINALSALRRELEAETPPNREFFPEVPFVALNVATVHGGAAVNIVPDRCVVDVGFRILPGMESAPVAERIRRAVADALGDEPFEISRVEESPPLLLAEDHDLYRTLCQTLDQHDTVSASYATDAGWFDTGGYDCLIWGPGTIEVAHKPNESMPKGEYQRASQLLDGFVEQFCGAA
ncbi:MAG: acetylornithine deacetylase [Acidobacteriota bacterium]